MIGLYHALIQIAGPDDVHKRVTIEAEDLTAAKALLEQEFGKGKVVSLRGERESRRIR